MARREPLLPPAEGDPVRRLVECRAIRAVVLLLALGVGGVAGAPTMALPPRAGVSISGDDDADGDDESGGGWGGPFAPNPPQDGPGAKGRAVADEHLLLATR